MRNALPASRDTWASDPLLQRSFVADRGDARRRLDRVLARHLADVPGVSRTRLQHAISNGRVEVNGRPAIRSAQRVSAGDVIEATLRLGRARASGITPEDVPIRVLYEDDDLLAVDKPAGIVVHPSYRNREGTLMNALAHYAAGWPSGRPSLVHRLDKHTSGVLLVAKSREAHADAARAMRAGSAIKEYLALCYGRMRWPRRRLQWPLGRDPFDRRRVAVRADGMEAVTEATRVAASRGENRGLTLVLCRLVTGRMHQVRVHLAEAGLPIVGDPVYGPPQWAEVRNPRLREHLRAFGRQALHAWRVQIRHPRSGDALVLTAGIPEEIAHLLREAGLPNPSEHGLGPSPGALFPGAPDLQARGPGTGHVARST